MHEMQESLARKLREEYTNQVNVIGQVLSHAVFCP